MLAMVRSICLCRVVEGVGSRALQLNLRSLHYLSVLFLSSPISLFLYSSLSLFIYSFCSFSYLHTVGAIAASHASRATFRKLPKVQEGNCG
jgi:hypothetical protein